MCADTHNIADGTSATIKIVEKDDDGNDDEVESPNTKVQNGKIKCKWKVVYMEDNDDTESRKEMEEKGYTLPEYAFTVECGGEKSTESGQLDIRGWILISFDKHDERIMKNYSFFLYCDDWKSELFSYDKDDIKLEPLPVFYKGKKLKVGVKKNV